MGIPSYFSTIKKKYAKHQKDWLLPSKPNDVRCKHFYVDLNGIVHCCAQNVVHKYELYMIETHKSFSFNQLQDCVLEKQHSIFNEVLKPQIFAAIIAELQQLVDDVQPTDLFYLALDGVAPRSKMEQQRQRRHRSVADKKLEQTVYNRHKTPYLRGMLWDSNCVTPGTEFMKELSAYIHSHVCKITCDCHVYVSDTSECGEGEHKIMEHMRKSGNPNAGEDNLTYSYVLHGQDADLIMLAFSFLSYHGMDIPFYLLREQTSHDTKEKNSRASSKTEEKGYTPSPPRTTDDTVQTICGMDWQYSHTKLAVDQYLSVNVLMRNVIQHMESYGDIYTKDEYERVIRDYVCMCFLLGNDFLPHSPSLSIQDKGIETLFEAYVPLRKQQGVFLTSVCCTHNEDEEDVYETHIHQPFLVCLIQKLAQQEDYLAGRHHINTLQKRKWMLQQQRYPREKRTPEFNRNTPYEYTQQHNNPQITLEHELAHLQTLHPACWVCDDKVLPGTPGWKKRYYQEVEQVTNMIDVHKMCQVYCAGLFWTMQYYMHGCWSTTWHYPYLSTPLFSNILYYLRQPRININRLVRRDITFHYTPIAQLLTVMPKESLEKYVYNLHVDKKDKQYRLKQHPTSYRLVAFSKRFRWECPVRLPFVDDEEVFELQKMFMTS